MTAYVDDAIWDWQGRKWCHLLADDIDALHRFARALGLHRTSYQGPPKTSCPHYDLTAFERDRALRLGAVACDRNAIVAVFRRARVRQERSPRASIYPLVPARTGTKGQAARPEFPALDSRLRGNERNSGCRANALAVQASM